MPHQPPSLPHSIQVGLSSRTNTVGLTLVNLYYKNAQARQRCVPVWLRLAYAAAAATHRFLWMSTWLCTSTRVSLLVPPRVRIMKGSLLLCRRPQRPFINNTRLINGVPLTEHGSDECVGECDWLFLACRPMNARFTVTHGLGFG